MIQVKREKVKGGKLGSILSLAAIFIGLYLLVVFLKGILEIRQAYHRVATAEAQLKAEEEKRIVLLDKKNQVATLDYVEEVARNELNMQKEGEMVVVLPEAKQNSEFRSQNSGKLEEEGEVANWRKWWRLVR